MVPYRVKSKGGSPEERPDGPPQSCCIVFCIILQNSLRNRRMTVAYSSMYSMLWNDQQRGKNKMAMHRDIAYCNEIKRCIVLSSFSRNIGKTKFFSNTFKKLRIKFIRCGSYILAHHHKVYSPQNHN